MRLATYIDDWFLAAQSPPQTQAHARLLKAHLAALGFTVNREKSVLTLTQKIMFIGLSAESVEASPARLALFRRRTRLKFRMCLRLLGLMASN